MTPDELADQLRQRFPDVLHARGEVTITILPQGLLEAMAFLRDEQDLSFRFLSDLTATDWPGLDPRFWVVYHLTSLEHRHRVRVKTGLTGESPHVASVTPMFPTANWHEREVFDFFGVVF